MKKEKKIQFVKNAIITWGYMPYFFVFSLLLFYFHTAFLLGKLPQPSIDDPKNFEIYQFYESIIIISASIVIYTFVIWMFLSIYFDRKYYFKFHKIHFILIFLGYLFSGMLFFSKIMTWFAD